MSRLLQVVIALVGLAITGVLGLASERSESLQIRHSLIGLFTETVSSARTNCDQGLASMAVGALQQLESLEANRFVLTPGDREDRAKIQALLANYQDYMAEVQGTIVSGGCRAGAVALASTSTSTGSGAGPAATGQPASSVLAQIRPEANAAIRQYEQQVQMQAQAPAEPAAAADDRGASPAPADIEIGERARAQLRVPVEAYYTVLASYPVGDDATYDPDRGVVANYQRLRRSAAEENLNVAVFQTGSSNHYAIVLVGQAAGSRSDARRNVVTARTRGWSSGALVQPARDWSQCPQPERITRAGGCTAQ
jgi:hypothetical protein